MGNREKGFDRLCSTRPIGFFIWVGGSEGLALSIVRLQSLYPLLIKLNKATLNWGDQMIFSSVDEWAFNLGLGGHWPDSSRGCCHDPHLWLSVSFGEGRQSRKYFWFLAKIWYQPLSNRVYLTGNSEMVKLDLPLQCLCTKRCPYWICTITNQYAQFWVLCSS